MPDRATIPALRLTESYFEAALERLSRPEIIDEERAPVEPGASASPARPGAPHLAAGDEARQEPSHDPCLRCGASDGVELECARTEYHFEGEPGSADDPNRPVPLCRPCAAEHHAHWDGMWADYYGGLL